MVHIFMGSFVSDFHDDSKTPRQCSLCGKALVIFINIWPAYVWVDLHSLCSNIFYISQVPLTSAKIIEKYTATSYMQDKNLYVGQD